MTSTAPDGSYSISHYQYGRLLSAERYSSSDTLLTSTTFAYDVHGRQHQVTDSVNGTTTYGYHPQADLIQSVTSPDPDQSGPAAPQVTLTYYNTSMRPFRVDLPDGTFTYTTYHLNGLVGKTYGSRTYPVEYAYDYAGRMETMTTWQEFNHTTGAGIAGSAITTWQYSPVRGWLAAKHYPDKDTAGQTTTIGTEYDYTDGGRLKSRVWARQGTSGRVTKIYQYGFDDATSDNQHGDLAGVSYSNDPQNTPSLTYAYDRRGRQNTVTQNDGVTSTTTTLAYNDANALTSESYTGVS